MSELPADVRAAGGGSPSQGLFRLGQSFDGVEQIDRPAAVELVLLAQDFHDVHNTLPLPEGTMETAGLILAHISQLLPGAGRCRCTLPKAPHFTAEMLQAGAAGSCRACGST